MGWIKYLFHWDRRPRLPGHLVTPFALQDVTDEELLIFKAGKARDRQYLARLMRQHKAQSARELLEKLPPPRRPSVRQRIAALIQRAEGSLPYDPMRREERAIRAAAQPTAAAYRRRPMKRLYRR